MSGSFYYKNSSKRKPRWRPLNSDETVKSTPKDSSSSTIQGERITFVARSPFRESSRKGTEERPLEGRYNRNFKKTYRHDRERKFPSQDNTYQPNNYYDETLIYNNMDYLVSAKSPTTPRTELMECYSARSANDSFLYASENSQDFDFTEWDHWDTFGSFSSPDITFEDQNVQIAFYLASLPSYYENYRELTPEEEKALKRFRGMLNRITLDNYSNLINQLYEHIYTHGQDLLVHHLDLVVEVAVDQTRYSHLYAEVCRDLFYNEWFYSYDGLQPQLYTQMLRRLNNVLFAILKIVGDDTDSKERRQSLGHMQFMGELFLRNMIPVEFIYYVLALFIQDIKEESADCNLESLCILLHCIGPALDETPPLHPIIEETYLALDFVTHSHSVARLRCLVQDLVDRRQSGWVQRRTGGG